MNRSEFAGMNISNYDYKTFYDTIFREDSKQAINMNLFYGRIASLYATDFNLQSPWDLPDNRNDDDPQTILPHNPNDLYHTYWLDQPVGGIK